MNAKIKQQVERIIDEGSGGRRSVIVQVAKEDEQREEVLDVVAGTMQERYMALSARELLPASKADLRVPRSGRRSDGSRERLAEAEDSVASNLAAAAVQPVARRQLRSSALAAIDELRKSDLVRRAVEKTVEEKGGKASDHVNVFWTSRSMLLDLDVDELRELTSLPNIREVHENRTLRVPPVARVRLVPAAVRDNKTSAWGVYQINALATWGAYGARGDGITIGLLDTGVDETHPDLQGKVDSWAEFDASGNEVPGSTAHDSYIHGTHCAGILVGGNSSGQFIGVAPNAKLAAALVLNGLQGGTDAQVLAGMDWVVDQGVDVISMSLGGLTLDVETPDTYTEAIISALRVGIPVVAAIGNEGSQTTGAPGNDLFSFGVGATDHRDVPAGFSGGRTHIIRSSRAIPPQYLPLVYAKPDISAPGTAILSAVPDGKWELLSGTSMATPHVAAAIALLLSATNIATNVAATQRAFVLQDIIIGSAKELGESGHDQRYGFGRLDVLRAIGYAHELGY